MFETNFIIIRNGTIYRRCRMAMKKDACNEEIKYRSWFVAHIIFHASCVTREEMTKILLYITSNVGAEIHDIV